MRKPIIFGVIGAAAFIALLVFIVPLLGGISTNSVTITKRAETTPDFVGTVAPFGKDMIVYADGVNLIKRNVNTGASEAISDDVGAGGLQNVHSLSVSSDNKYILFRDEGAPDDGALAQTLHDAGLNPLLGYWWVFDVANRSFHPIPQQDTLQAKLDGNKVIVLASANSFTTVTTYDIATLKKGTTLNTPPATNVFAAPDGGLLLQYEGDVYTTKDGVVSRRVLESIRLTGLTADKKYAIGIRGSKNATELVRIDTANWSAKKIASDVDSDPVWNGSGTALYYSNYGNDTKPDNRLFTYDFDTNKVESWSVAKNIQNGSYIPQGLLNKNTALVSNADGTYYLLGASDLSKFPTE